MHDRGTMGAVTPAVCFNCGAELLASARFCTECGKLVGVPIPEQGGGVSPAGPAPAMAGPGGRPGQTPVPVASLPVARAPVKGGEPGYRVYSCGRQRFTAHRAGHVLRAFTEDRLLPELGRPAAQYARGDTARPPGDPDDEGCIALRIPADLRSRRWHAVVDITLSRSGEEMNVHLVCYAWHEWRNWALPLGALCYVWVLPGFVLGVKAAGSLQDACHVPHGTLMATTLGLAVVGGMVLLPVPAWILVASSTEGADATPAGGAKVAPASVAVEGKGVLGGVIGIVAGVMERTFQRVIKHPPEP